MLIYQILNERRTLIGLYWLAQQLLTAMSCTTCVCACIVCGIQFKFIRHEQHDNHQIIKNIYNHPLNDL